MRGFRSIASVALVVGISVLGIQPASAAVPSNDRSGGAVPVSVGFSQVIDTTAATTDADDAQLNETCGAPATDASVWYTVSPTSDGGIIVDVSGSDYSAGVLVGVGTPGSLETVACGAGTVDIFASAGTTYYVLAVDDQDDGSGNGDSLHISINPGPPPPTVDVTIAPRGTFNSKTGRVTLYGAYTCTDVDWVELSGSVSQTVGRIGTIRGDFSIPVDAGTCDGLSHPWSATVSPQAGKFSGGKSLTVAFSFACGRFECASGYTSSRRSD